jgi:hypothetical protein
MLIFEIPPNHLGYNFPAPRSCRLYAINACEFMKGIDVRIIVDLH